LYPDEVALQIRALVPQLEDHKFSGTTHYTIVLGEDGATRCAGLIGEVAGKIRSTTET
jgi:hypothetical protein